MSEYCHRKAVRMKISEEEACKIFNVNDSWDIAEQLEKAKRLLKMAVEDFSNIYDHIFYCDGMCDTCPIHGNRDTCDKWVHADEALKLIGDESSGV